MKHKVDTETVFLHVSLNIFLTVSFLGLQWSRKKKISLCVHSKLSRLAS